MAEGNARLIHAGCSPQPAGPWPRVQRGEGARRPVSPCCLHICLLNCLTSTTWLLALRAPYPQGFPVGFGVCSLETSSTQSSLDFNLNTCFLRTTPIPTSHTLTCRYALVHTPHIHTPHIPHVPHITHPTYTHTHLTYCTSHIHITHLTYTYQTPHIHIYIHLTYHTYSSHHTCTHIYTHHTPHMHTPHTPYIHISHTTHHTHTTHLTYTHHTYHTHASHLTYTQHTPHMCTAYV